MKNLLITFLVVLSCSVVVNAQVDTCINQTPGDVNDDGFININDITFLTGFLTGYGDAPNVLANADPNGDCIIDFDDITYLENFLFTAGNPPVDCTCLLPDTCSFQLPGDVDNSGTINISDVIYLLAFLESGGPKPPVLANADVNGDCVIDANDATAIQLFLSGGGTLVDCTCISPSFDPCILQKPGDFNSDSFFDISDMVYFTAYLLGSGPAPNPIANADANGDCIINVGDSKLMNDFLFLGGPPPVNCTCPDPGFLTVCCWDFRGNVNYDPVDIIDISDLTFLVEHMFFQDVNLLVCEEEADIDGSGTIDISDLVHLVFYMFDDVQGVPPAPCN